MKTKLTVMAAAILMGTAFTVNATAYGGLYPPAPPFPYGSGPLKAPYLAPNLFISEKAAFAGLEGAMQEAEGVIYQGGCAAASGTWRINAFADDTGNGSVRVSSGGATQFRLNVAWQAVTSPPYLGGTKFHITGGTPNHLGGVKLPLYDGTAYYSGTGQMMVMDARFDVGNVNYAFDHLTGTVIKDFFKVLPQGVYPDEGKTTCKSDCGGYDPTVPVIYDWGLQSVSKEWVPQDKWWQRSKATRSDGSDAKTIFWKDRLFSAKNGGVCKIKIAMTGANDADGFAQSGTLTIKKEAP
jgi:hypothetical protein